MIKPGKGIFIKNTGLLPLTLQDWFDLNKTTVADQNEIRMQNEILSVRLATERATDEEVHSIKEIHNKFIKAVEDGRVSELRGLDNQFHGAIASASHNSLLVMIINLISEMLYEQKTFSFISNDMGENALHEHGIILECIEKRDADAGVEAMRSHIKSTYTVFLR
ncbi:MAG: FCD domain-containing protein [Lachnospiraceae bacterium]|nr:FCD domain-containing protein [Lachnospiraceae bacterium]